MEKVAYQLKDVFSKVKAYFSSPKFLRFWDKFMKIMRTIIPQLAIYAVLIAFSYIFMSPILRVIVDSVKTPDDILNPDVVWVPTQLTFQNYKDASKALLISRTYKALGNTWISTLLNSTLYSLITAILQTVVSCTAGYAFARFSFKGKKIWFFGLILAFVLPTQLLALPRQMILRPLMNQTSSPSVLLGLTKSNNRLDGALSIVKTIPILLITMFGQGINSSILTFIAFSFFKMIPNALDEAAQIDGANFFQIFYHVILKMSVPTILVVFLFAFIWNWNDTYSLKNLTALGQNQLAFQTLPEALDNFNYLISQGTGESGIKPEDQEHNNAALQSASIIISISPLLILYAFTQRKFVEGIENTGVTGV